jgi:hypothetical protein
MTTIAPELTELLSFTREIGGYVSAHSAWRLRSRPSATMMSFEGDIPIGRLKVRLSFTTRPDWRNHSPVVHCDASWIRKEVQWHAPADGTLCWVFNPYWCDVLDECSEVLSDSELRQMAAYWCVAGAADLVGKHHFADTHGIKDWPKAWEAWAHADDAAFQLKNMKASGEFQRSARELRKRAKAARAFAVIGLNWSLTQ